MSESKSKPERILVRGVNWLGDAVMTTPALMRLREAHPGAEIHVATLEKLAELWRGHPAVDRVIPLQKKGAIGAVARELRAGRYDVGLVLPNSFRSALEVWLGRIPVRIGYAGNGRRWLLTRAVARRPGETGMRKRPVGEIKALVADRSRQRETFPTEAHQVFNYLHLAKAAGASDAPLAPLLRVASDEWEAFRRRFGLPGAIKLAGLNPGAEYGPAKRWPRERFIEAARMVARERPVHWILFGGHADVETASEIERALEPIQVTNVSGKTSLRELCAGLSLCQVVLTNDTGPMHLAAALGAKVVTPFGSTSPELTGPGLPGQGRHRLIPGRAECAPCFRRECPIDFRCMRSIGADEVARAVLEELGD